MDWMKFSGSTFGVLRIIIRILNMHQSINLGQRMTMLRLHRIWLTSRLI